MPKHPLKEKKSPGRTPAAKKLNANGPNGFAPPPGLRRAKPKASPFNSLNVGVALGIVALGVAGAATFVVLNSKKRTKSLRGNLYQKYQILKDEAQDYAHDAYERGRQVYDSAADYAEGLREAAHDAMEQPHSGSLLLAGAIGGTLLGATAIYALSRRQHPASQPQDFLSKMVDVFGNVKHAAESLTDQAKSGHWLESAKQFIESLQEHTDAHFEEERDEESAYRRQPSSSPLRDAIHLGIIGLRLWENLSQRRR